jgi:hypothetical protein
MDNNMNNDITFLTANNERTRSVDLDTQELSAITIGNNLIVVNDKSIRINFDAKNAVIKGNEIFINR